MLAAAPQKFATAIRRKNYLKTLRRMAPHGRFLEIGPGNGEMLPVAAEAGFSALEIADIDAGVIQRVKTWYPEVTPHHVSVTEPLSNTLGSNRFSCIVACHVFEHVPSDSRLSMLKDCYHMLQPGGCLILELPNPLCPLGGWSNFLADPTHQMPVSSTGLIKLAALAGFDTAKAGAVRPIFTPKRLPGILRWLASQCIGALSNAVGRTSDIRSPTFFVIAHRS